MSLEVIYRLENLTPVGKCGEIELPSVSCLNNVETYFHNVFTLIKYIKMLTIYQQ